MTNYVLLYRGGGMPETEEEKAAVMAAWGAWYESMGEALQDGGNPIGPTARTISGDRSVSEGASPATGYTIISADSIDAAVEMAKGCPNLDAGGTVSVCETFQVM